MEIADKLHDIVWNGLQVDIYEAEEALALVKEIGLNATVINEAKYGFGHLFGRLQHVHTEMAILAVNRIYDKPKRHTLRSLPSALELLQANSSTLKPVDRRYVSKKLIEFGHPETKIKSLEDTQATELLAREYTNRLPSLADGGPTGLNALKFRRDKKLAHPEAINVTDIPPITYKQIHDLLSFAKDFIATVGLSYLSIVYVVDDGTFLLSRDAEDIVRPLRRLLQRAGIIADAAQAEPAGTVGPD